MMDFFVCYGSQTGNSEAIANRIGKEAREYGLRPTVFAGNSFKSHGFEHLDRPTVLVLVTSSTGNGDPPENISRFYRFVKRKTHESNLFENLSYAVLALGDTNYDKFCWIGRVFDKRFEELGGKRFMRRGEADDGVGLEMVVEPWVRALHICLATVVKGTSFSSIDGRAFVAERGLEGNIADFAHASQPEGVDRNANAAAADEGIPKEHWRKVIRNLPSLEEDHAITIVYGSQTGCAESVATRLRDEVAERGYRVTLITGNAFKEHNLDAPQSSRVLIVLTSVTGNGDPPDNIAKFYRYIKRKTHPPQLFENVWFTVLGFGDTNYDRFNVIGKAIDRRLEELGATRFYGRGESDEAIGVETVVEPWLTGLWKSLSLLFERIGEMKYVHPISVELLRKHPSSDLCCEATGDHVSHGTQPEHDEASQNKEAHSVTNTVSEIEAQPTKIQETLSSVAKERQENKNRMPSDAVELSAKPLEADYGSLPRLLPVAFRLIKLSDPAGTSITGSSMSSDDGDSSSADKGWKGYSVSCPAEVFLSKAKYLTAKESTDRRVVHMELDVGGSGLTFVPGDAVGILCRNDDNLVDQLAKRLGVSLYLRFFLETVEIEPLSSTQKLTKSIRKTRMKASRRVMAGGTSGRFSRAVTVKEALSTMVDVTSLPKKSLLRLLAEYTSDPTERHRLLWLSCSKGKMDYDNQIRKWCPTLLDLLEAFPSCNPPLERLLPALQVLSPRYYSISNSPISDPSHIHFAFSVVEYETLWPQKCLRKGVCTSWLEAVAKPFLESSDYRPLERPCLRVFIQASADFKIPDNLSDNVVMIGPGTGVAPFRGFLDHRRQLYLCHIQQQEDMAERCRGCYRGIDFEIDDEDVDELDNQFLGESWLYFGCRARHLDYLYHEELEYFVQDGTLSSLRVAFSRESSQKVYVQDLLQEDGKELIDFVLKGDAFIYICGDGANMARDVEAELLRLLEKYGGMTPEKAKRTLREWAIQKRYVKDIWS